MSDLGLGEALLRQQGQRPTGLGPVQQTRPSTLPRLRTSTISIPSGVKIGASKRAEKKEDKGILGSILSIPMSGLKAIGTGVAAIPTFIGKVGQTAYGFGEGLYDLALDTIDEDIFTSRFETDLDRGRELGLEGDALVAYAAHRQYPLGQMLVESGVGTGRRLAEVATAGKYDYGQPGIDYARAFREGNLGAVAVEDIGNVILAGRATGAGNVVARAGGALETTAPRLGKAVATTGRLIEEPVGETVRQTARLAGNKIPVNPISSRFKRVGEAERPLRVMMKEIADAYKMEQERKLGGMDVEIADLIRQRDAAQSAGNTTTAENLQFEINRLEEARTKRVQGTGLVRAGQRIAKRMTVETERARQNIIQQFQRLADFGAAPERPAVYRARATRLREQAQAAAETDSVKAQDLRDAADALDRVADLKEQFPDQFDQPLAAEMQEGAILAGVKGQALLDLEKQGWLFDDIVRAAADPTVGPALQELGMLPTAEGVRMAIEYIKAKRGETTMLSPAQVFQLDSVYALLKQWSDTNRRLMAEGKGLPEGPAPFTWFELFPNPEYLLNELKISNTQTAAVTQILDVTAAQLIASAINVNALPASILDEWGINLDNPEGLFAALVAQGPGSVAYRMAFDVVRLNYRRLMTVAPDVMMNPDIYPATMRPTVITQRQAIRRATGYDVETVVTELLRLEDEFDTLIPENILKGIGRDLETALNPQAKITKTAWSKVVKRLDSIREYANTQRLKLESQASALSLEQQQTLTKLIELQQALDAADRVVQNIAAQPPAMSPRLIRATTRLSELESERGRLEQERAQLDEQLQEAARQEVPEAAGLRIEQSNQQTRLQSLESRLDELTAQIDELRAEYDTLRQDLATYNALSDEDISFLIEDLQTLDRLGAQSVREPTKAEVQAFKRQEQARLDQELADAERNTADMVEGLGPLRRDSEVWDAAAGRSLRRDESIDGSEDFRESVKQVLGTEEAYQSFLERYTEIDTAQRAVDGTPDNGAQNYNSRTGNNLNDMDWLLELARRYRIQFDAEKAVRQGRRRTLAQYKDDLIRSRRTDDARMVDESTRTGLDARTIERMIDFDDRNVLNEAQRRAQVLEAQLSRLENEANRLRADRETARRNLSEISARLQPPMPKGASQRRTEINTRLSQINKQLVGAKRSVQFARRAEPKEAVTAERKRLTGTPYDVTRPSGGGEGPTRGRLRRGAQGRNTAEQARLNAEATRQTTRLNRVRRDIQAQQELGAEAATLDLETLQRPQMTGDQAPFGPELFRPGEEPLYLPAGPTRRMVPSRQMDMEIRGEGAGAQTRLQASQQRISGAVVLDLANMAQRIYETLTQQYRNMAVDEIITDPTITQRVEQLLDADTRQALRQQAEERVSEQPIERNSAEWNSQVAREYGGYVMKELELLGYEPVAPQKFDPETGGHEPLGTLSTTVLPEQIADNTPVMRKGVAQRLFSQYEPTGVRNIPTLVERVLNLTGKGTQKWKSVILPLSLRWQIGDAVGIVLFAWARGDIPPRQLVSRIREVISRMTDPTDARLGSVLFGDVLEKAFGDPVMAAGFGNALQGRGLRTPDVEFLDRLSAKVSGVAPSTGALRWFDEYRLRAFRFNEAINSIGRAAVFIENLDRILKEQGRSLDEINGPNTIGDTAIHESIRQAVDATNETLGAFSDLSPWEKQVFRNIFPFWSWIRFINKAAFDLAVDSPERVLLAAHLGSMATEGDDNGLADWLRGKTPVLGTFVDLNFLNPYSDAVLFNRNPFTDILETGTSVSPAITYPLTVANELYYGGTGRNLPLMPQLSRPGYLEGRPGATTRGIGDVLGGIAYKGLTTFGGPLRNILDVLPEGQIPFTDIATGPVTRFGQGSLRTTGAFAEPRLGPVAGRISPLLRTFGIPAPLVNENLARRQAQQQAQRDRAARLRRIKERQAAG